MWDRHSARWIGLKCRHPEAQKQLTLFTGPESEEELNGLVCHREMSVDGGEIGVVVDVNHLLEMLRLWSPDFIDSVRLQAGGKFLTILPGHPVMALDQCVNVVTPYKRHRAPVKEGEEKRQSRRKQKKR